MQEMNIKIETYNKKKKAHTKNVKMTSKYVSSIDT